jgi:hypothetical protein
VEWIFGDHDGTPREVEMEQTSAKLRRTFRYPTDGDEDDDLPEALDEEGYFPVSSFLSLTSIYPSIYPLTYTHTLTLSTLPFSPLHSMKTPQPDILTHL